MCERDLDMHGLAAVLGVSHEWVRRRVMARTVPFHRRGRLVRFTPGDVEAIRSMGAEPVIATPVRADTVRPGTPPPSPPPPQPDRPAGPAQPPKAARLRAVA